MVADLILMVCEKMFLGERKATFSLRFFCLDIVYIPGSQEAKALCRNKYCKQVVLRIWPLDQQHQHHWEILRNADFQA